MQCNAKKRCLGVKGQGSASTCHEEQLAWHGGSEQYGRVVGINVVLCTSVGEKPGFEAAQPNRTGAAGEREEGLP